MPIYEFKCLKCQEFFELLLINQNENVEMKCPKCGAEDFERIMSATNYAMGMPGAGGNSQPSAQTRTCSSGSCTTIDLPGHSRQ